MNACVTGANGFIGRHLVQRLVEEGWIVTVYDRKPEVPGPWHRYVQGEIEDAPTLMDAMREADVVFHLAALADVRHSLVQAREQHRLNSTITLDVLEAMRLTHVSRLVFTSSAVVYGDSSGVLSERGWAFPQQTSVYGAMKLASESLISAYCTGYNMHADIFRMVSLVGAGYRHGNLMDFYRKLQADPTRIEILGTGRQQKYYIDVHDVVEAMLTTLQASYTGAQLWNISHDHPNTINDAVDTVCEVLHLDPERVHVGDPWAGDLPGLMLDCTKLRSLGWIPRVSIKEGMRASVQNFCERGV